MIHRILFLALAFAANSLSLCAQNTSDHNLEVGKSLDIFNNAFRHLDLVYVDTLDPSASINRALKGMLQSLDPYTEFYPAGDSEELQMMLTGKYAGIGALIKYHIGRGCAVIDEPYEGMPAAEVGLRKGDVIVAIDDSLMEGKSTSYVSQRLRGDAGTSFVLRVERPVPEGALDGRGRPAKPQQLTFKITRRNIQTPSLPYYGMTSDSIAYIDFNQFTENSAREVRRAFVDLKKQGARALVLDLRGNGGGSESEAVDIVNLWVGKGQTVVENRGKVQQACHAYETRYEPVDTLMPIVVLVDENTASSSEITSGALQDLDRAVVMGNRTYGKGLVQIPMDLPYNASIKITTAHYYLPSGRCIQKVAYGGTRAATAAKDSLANVFHTAGGREVFGGGGITPDLKVLQDTLPVIAYYLSATGLDSTEVMFDYIVDYIARHEQIAPAADFQLSEADWQEFRQRVIDSGFRYNLGSRQALSELVRIAKVEGYYDDAREAFDLLSRQLHHDVGQDLDRHRDIIEQIIIMEIIGAYYYQKGTIERGLQYDRVYQEALKLLRQPRAYEELLRASAQVSGVVREQ